MTNSPNKKMTLPEATYRNTKALREMLEPIQSLAKLAQDTHQQSPIAMLLEIVSKGQEADRLIIERLDRIISLLSEPVIEKAVKEMLRG